MDLIDKAKLETFMNDWMLNVSGDGYEKMSKRKQARYDTLEQVFDAVSRFPTISPKELLSTLWRNSKADPPKEDDAGQYGKVIVWYKRAEATLPMLWWMVEESADKYPYWMPMPESPKEE